MFYMRRVNMSPSLWITSNHPFLEVVVYREPSPQMNDGVCTPPRPLQVWVENQGSRLNESYSAYPLDLCEMINPIEVRVAHG